MMLDYFAKLFDTSDFVPRAVCGRWTPGLVWLHAASDVFIWLAYLSIPTVLVILTRGRSRLPMTRIVWLFAAFILACGFTHLLDALMFHAPVYRLMGLAKLITAVISWATVVALITAVPQLLAWVDQRSEPASALPTPIRPEPRLNDYIIAVLVVIVVIAARAALITVLKGDHAFVLPLMGVVYVAWRSGFGPAMTTLVLSMVAVVSIFLFPWENPHADSISDQMATGLFVFCGVAAALLGETQRRAVHRAERTASDLAVVNLEYQRAQVDVRANEARYRLLTESLPLIVWNADPAGRLVYVNQQWGKYTGTPGEAAFTDTWGNTLHPEDFDRVTALWGAAVTQGSASYAAEFRFRKADGTYRWFVARAVPLLRADGSVDQWIGSIADIDDQKREAEWLEEMILERTTELKRSNEELEKFAYVASHDLQEPLRKIQAFSDRLVGRYGGELGPQGQEYIDRIQISAGRMRTLIDDLLAFSRVTSNVRPFVPVEISGILNGVLSDLEQQLGRTGGVVEAGPLPTVLADPLQMRQLLTNLVGNALKFHRPNVPPRVMIAAMPLNEVPRDAEPPPLPGPGWRLTIRDNGIGFEPVYAKRIFEVFQRLHGRGEYEGTGIGLAICRKIAERHRGAIAALSRPGDGATFVIDLPVDPTREG